MSFQRTDDFDNTRTGSNQFGDNSNQPTENFTTGNSGPGGTNVGEYQTHTQGGQGHHGHGLGTDKSGITGTDNTGLGSVGAGEHHNRRGDDAYSSNTGNYDSGANLGNENRFPAGSTALGAGVGSETGPEHHTRREGDAYSSSTGTGANFGGENRMPAGSTALGTGTGSGTGPTSGTGVGHSAGTGVGHTSGTGVGHTSGTGTGVGNRLDNFDNNDHTTKQSGYGQSGNTTQGHATFGDKMRGGVEKVAGKVTKNPELVERGQERAAGERNL